MYNYRIPNKTTFPIALRVSDDEREAMEEKIAKTNNYKNGFVNN